MYILCSMSSVFILTFRVSGPKYSAVIAYPSINSCSGPNLFGMPGLIFLKIQTGWWQHEQYKWRVAASLHSSIHMQISAWLFYEFSWHAFAAVAWTVGNAADVNCSQDTDAFICQRWCSPLCWQSALPQLQLLKVTQLLPWKTPTQRHAGTNVTCLYLEWPNMHNSCHRGSRFPTHTKKQRSKFLECDSHNRCKIIVIFLY